MMKKSTRVPPLFLIAVFFILFKIQLSYSQEKKDPLEDSIQVQANLGDEKKALGFAQKLAQKTKATHGEKSLEYGRILSKLGLWQLYNNKPEEAFSTLNQALALQNGMPKAKPEDLSNTWYALGKYWEGKHEVQKKIECFQNRVDMSKLAFGEISAKVAYGEMQLGVAYIQAGNYQKAEMHLLTAADLYKKLHITQDKDIAELYRFLGILYKDMGNFPKVEKYFSMALPICQNLYGENHAKTGEAYNNIGAALQMVRNSEKALVYFLKALEIRKKTKGEESDEVGQSYLNLAVLYDDINKMEESLKCHDLAIRLLTKSRGETNEFVGYAYLNAGSTLMDANCFNKSLQYIKKARHIQQQIQPEGHPDMALVDINLSMLFNKTGQYDSALYYGNKAMGTWKKFQRPTYFGFIAAYSTLGLVRFNQKRYEDASPMFKSSNEVFLQLISQNFPSLSDQEKEDFFYSVFDHIGEFKSFCAQAGNRIPALSGDLYDFQLATKGLLLNSSAKWKHRIKHSGDVKLFNQYTRWLDMQKEIQALQQSGDSTEQAGLDSLTKLANALEKDLSLRSEVFAQLADKRKYTWKDIQKTLKPGEAAIEILRTQKYGGLGMITDTTDPQKRRYALLGQSDTIQYLALIIKPESLYPEMVLLKNGNDMEQRNLDFYQKCIRNQILDDRTFSVFWEKINAHLQGTRRIYFSPDGVYHHLNINTIWNPKSKKYIMEEKEVYLLTTTRDLMLPSTKETQTKLAYLVGFPSYYSQPQVAVRDEKTRKSPELTYGLQWTSEATLQELPSTKTEIEKINHLLLDNGWQVQTYLADEALEENLKESYKPGLLHIATHGFFQPDVENKRNPLLSSGLMLAGAGNTLRGNIKSQAEDGILTAYEAMNLNLDNTDLVVLSACETGLGEIRNGEGVYGLQRAFKVAGARSVIMSLWKVDDEATQELMVGFYKHWLSEGGNKRAAFLKAQKELKAKYPNPYYWGAFVMVGE